MTTLYELEQKKKRLLAMKEARDEQDKIGMKRKNLMKEIKMLENPRKEKFKSGLFSVSKTVGKTTAIGAGKIGKAFYNSLEKATRPQPTTKRRRK